MDEQKEKILAFLKQNKLAVVATARDDGSPQAAVMSVSQTDDLHLIFQTSIHSRKYMIIKHNPHVAVVFGHDLEEFTTVQYEGEACEVETEEEINTCRKIHINKNPLSENYSYLPENKFFKITPKWIRYWNFKKDEKIEIKF